MKKHMKKRSFALLAVAVCIVLAIPALAFGSAGVFSTESRVQTESALDAEEIMVFVIAMNREPVILLGALVKAWGTGE